MDQALSWFHIKQYYFKSLWKEVIFLSPQLPLAGVEQPMNGGWGLGVEGFGNTLMLDYEQYVDIGI